MTFDNAIQEYEKYMLSSTRSSNTMRNVICTLNKFKDSYGYKDISELSVNFTYDYPNKLKERGVSGNSSNIYMNHIKKFVDFLNEFDYIESNIGAHIKLKKKSDALMQKGKLQYRNQNNKVGRIISRDELELLKKTAKRLYPDSNKYALMIEMLSVAGFRIMEILLFRLENIDFDSEMIQLIRKRNKDHSFYLGWPDLANRLRIYCNENNITKPDDLLFPKDKDKTSPIPYSTMVGIFRKIFRAAELEYGKANGGFTSHDFRRTCATTLHDNGNGLKLEEIQELFGHDDPRTTAGYITRTIDEQTKKRQREAVARAFYE